MKSFPFIRQFESVDCGPTCVRMIAKHYGKNYEQKTIRDMSDASASGTSLLSLGQTAEALGMRAVGVRLTFASLAADVALPCIVFWKRAHFIVVYKIKKNKISIADPAIGLLTYSLGDFLSGWVGGEGDIDGEGAAMLLEPTAAFYRRPDDGASGADFRFILAYVRNYRRFIVQLILGLFLGIVFQLLAPFLAQALVDYGINYRNLTFVHIVLIAQVALMLGRTSLEFIRSWILLHVSTRINISMISDLLAKLLRLPISFFDTRKVGDIMQRIGDQQRVQNFLTSSTLSILFSSLNLLVFGVVLLIYDVNIFVIFAIGSTLYALWVYLFMKKRRELDFKRFAQLADNQSMLFQLITAVQEIKLNNCETQKRWEWEGIQAKLFRISTKGLSLGQSQGAGAALINEAKNLLITLLVAQAVVGGRMTLGMMLAVQYIIGQLSGPIEQMIAFLHSFQDAKISLERIAEIHARDDEDRIETGHGVGLPQDKTVTISHLTYKYGGAGSEFVLRDLNLTIPAKKVTAIVGVSGSGKTTLLKLLLLFYDSYEGEILVGGRSLKAFNRKYWRRNCGVVMQEGYIFADTVLGNIALGEDLVDREWLEACARIASIHDFIEGLPRGYDTPIGAEGHGLSQGQKQRILIARAVYKRPEFLFFDEATNALDANNETAVMENLKRVFENRTAIIVAHRLSTVKLADQIVVLDQGKIVERGNHDELTSMHGIYYRLVRNQLELGNN
jgi:ATP-binding cassette, subfamily B, bacterial